MFTREEIIVRSNFVYKFSLTIRRVKVPSFQGLNEMNLVLVTTSLNIQKRSIKNFETSFKHWHFSAIDFQIMLDGQKSNFFAKKCLTVASDVIVILFLRYVFPFASKAFAFPFYSKFLIINTKAKY